MANLLWRRQSSTLATQFRQAMTGVAAPAMILTLASAKGKGSLHGMTVGSFTLVLVMPTPKVSFNLHLPLYTLDELRHHKYCAVHVLPPTAYLAQLARQFAKGVKVAKLSKLAVTPEEKRDGEPFHEMTTPFALLKQGEDWDYFSVDDAVEIPVLTNCERVFICKAIDRLVVDSHELWVAEVVRIIGNLKHLPLGGLLYYRRNFHRVGMPMSR